MFVSNFANANNFTRRYSKINSIFKDQSLLYSITQSTVTNINAQLCFLCLLEVNPNFKFEALKFILYFLYNLRVSIYFRIEIYSFVNEVLGISFD